MKQIIDLFFTFFQFIPLLGTERAKNLCSQLTRFSKHMFRRLIKKGI